MKKATRTVMQLVTSLTLSLVAAFFLIKGAIYLNYRETLTLTLPALPVLFPLFYRFLGREAGPAAMLDDASKRSPFWRRHFSLRFSEMRSLRTVLIGVTLSLAVKFLMEGLFLYTFYRKSGLAFHVLFGGWKDHLVARFLRGELLMVTGSQVVPLLVVELLILTAVGGLWIGFSSSGAPMLEGVFAGTILAFFATLTNLTLVYSRIESFTWSAASLLDAHYSVAFSLAGPLFQVFLYGCWTLLGQRWRRERSSRSAAPDRALRANRAR